MNFSQLEKYASPIVVYSDLSPAGRIERAFVQPLLVTSEGFGEPGEPGRSGGRYLLIAAAEAISADEQSVRIAFGGGLFRLLRREEFGQGIAGHIECLLRYLGRESHA
jgi:hypothetical protein